MTYTYYIYIGTALVNFGTANEKIANAQVEYISRIREEFLIELEDYIKELKQYQVISKINYFT